VIKSQRLVGKSCDPHFSVDRRLGENQGTGGERERGLKTDTGFGF